MIKIKICGITNYDDAKAAVDAGTDALGFIFAKSPRQVQPDQVRDIIMKLPSLVKTVGVFVNEDNNRISELINYCGIDNVQLHGNEDTETCKKFMPRSIKAFKIKDESSIAQCRKYTASVKSFLLDTYSDKTAGGTGKTFNWDLALKVKEFGVPVILAGGISPANIIEAIDKVKPYAIDLSSGVEECPGKKDHALIKELFKILGENI